MRVILVMLSLFIVFPLLVHAKPAIVYQYGKAFNVIDINGLVGIEAPMVDPGDGCSQRIADLTVDEVVYNGVSDSIAGFRAKKPAPKEWYGLFTIDSDAVYGALSKNEAYDIRRLIKKGERIIVIYQVCGSGGFASVIDIFKKSAINNP